MTVEETLKELSSPLNEKADSAIVILAAGHGKRIKSEKSKMLHEIWGVSTVERVYKACVSAIPKANVIITVGVKAESVASSVGKKKALTYAYQKQQLGTGHAVQVGLSVAKMPSVKHCFVLPGDMGLMYGAKMKAFVKEFNKSGNQMMVLTGMYQGRGIENYYGRVIRAKSHTKDGKKSDNEALVIEIKEYKDILALKGDYEVEFRGERFVYSKEELIETAEFNSGVYAFSMKHLKDEIGNITTENAQNEIYLTDMISIFNRKGLSVGASVSDDITSVLGFNNKSVLKDMEKIARERAYERLKDIITIDAPDDFYIADEVIDYIEKMDKKGIPLDIKIGKGVYIDKGVKLNYSVHLEKNVSVIGNVIFGENVSIGAGALLSCYENQKLVIGSNVRILWADAIKGQINIGEGSVIESSVNITGSDEFPVVIGKNVLIKGTSYIFGCVIEDDIYIEHSVLKNKRIRRVETHTGEVRKIRYVLPQPEGLDSIYDL